MSKPGKVLVIGSGPIRIGQAGEFDYSGSQAIKALKEEGIFTILLNPNVASVQTRKGFADKVYFLPVNLESVIQIIEKEKPDGILLGFGGQTGLNLGLELIKENILEKHRVKVLGTPIEVIRQTESRREFAEKCRSLGIKVPLSFSVRTKEEALKAAGKTGYPVICRSSFSLGGLNSAIFNNESELRQGIGRLFTAEAELLLEEGLGGWKEIEYEILRDSYDNCIAVCCMENIDPVGIHTGDSIVVAPPQTLNNREYFRYRELAFRLIRNLGIVGECNIQFALAVDSDDYRVIEVNARLSRSSALASKAAGYPLAMVATKLALGYALPDLINPVTGNTSACFEPALDYFVVKIPIWDFEKFPKAENRLNTEMKSVGEVMAIGGSFAEALQKAMRMLNKPWPDFSGMSSEELETGLKYPTDKRIYLIFEAFRRGMDMEKAWELAGINRWFLDKIREITGLETEIRQYSPVFLFQ